MVGIAELVCRTVEPRQIRWCRSSTRGAELLALRSGNVDLDARILRVMETVYDGHFDKPKTKRGKRAIPIGAETANVLAALRPSFVDPTRLVFAKSDGKPIPRFKVHDRKFCDVD